jgi:hypothetical protein
VKEASKSYLSCESRFLCYLDATALSTPSPFNTRSQMIK